MKHRDSVLRMAVMLIAAFPALSFAQPATPGAVRAVDTLSVIRKKRPSELSSKGMIGAIGDTVPLKAILKSKADDKPLPGKTLLFKIAGKDVGSAKTGATGEAKLDYKVPNSPPPGPAPMEIHFAGDDDWAGSSASANLGVLKSSTKITLSVSPAKGLREGETASVGGQLSRITDHQGVDGRQLQLTINGKPCGKVTTIGGSFSLSYPIPKGFGNKGTVEARFDGDVLYNPMAGTTEFSVMGPLKQGYLTWQNANGKVGENVTLRGTLSRSPTGSGGIGGQTVRFWMETEGAAGGSGNPHTVTLCQGTTNAEGAVACIAKLPEPTWFSISATGWYPLRAFADVNFDEWKIDLLQGFIQKAQNNPGIKISPSPVHLALTGPSSAHIGAKISIKVKLTRTSDGSPISDSSVSLGALTRKTDASGDATFELTVESYVGTGPRVFKATFGGRAQAYDKGEGSLTINVQPSMS